MTLPDGPDKYIHVSPADIGSNSMLPESQWHPVCVVKCDDQVHYAYRVDIHGPSSLLYEPERRSGATVRIHTTAPITLHTRWPIEGS